MERRRISSGTVFVFKYIFPALLAIWAVSLSLFGQWNSHPPHFLIRILIAIILLSICVFAIVFAASFAVVDLDDNNIYIIKWKKELAIPLSEVRDVTEWKLSNPAILTIHLHGKNWIWQKIRFTVPHYVVSMPYLPDNPLVKQILELAEESREAKK